MFLYLKVINILIFIPDKYFSYFKSDITCEDERLLVGKILPEYF
jgi:hypothetical protein